MKRALYEIREDDEEEWRISDNPEFADHQRPLDTHAVSLEQLAEYCDFMAEQRNNHEFIGAHHILAALLIDELGRDTTKAIMLRIAEHGGLDSMNGVGGEQDAFVDFKTPDEEDTTSWGLVDRIAGQFRDC